MAIAAQLGGGCSGSIEIGRPTPAAPIAIPAGDRVIEPNGEVIEPAKPAIETVLTGLSQAQSVRQLTRQLAR